MTQLTLEQVQKKAPAAFATNHAMSERYAQVKTTELLERLADSGFHPVDAKQDNPTKRDPSQVTHAITLRHEQFLKPSVKVNAQVPQITLVNSHNGRTKCRLYGGFFRLVCLNGLVVGRPDFMAELRHSGDALVEAAVAAENMADDLHVMGESIELWSSLNISAHRRNQFARDAASLRFGELSKQYDTSALLASRRKEDEGDDLWRIFNRVQENATQGGVVGETGAGRQVSSRALTSIQPNIAFNRQLWELADSVAQKVAA